MKASDLRIGNLLIHWDKVKEVSTLHNDNTLRFKTGESSEGCFSIKNVQPIPLSEEWLLKFGFGFEDRYNDYWLPDCEFYVNKNKHTGEYWVYMKNGDEDACLTTIEYVHQLQNLYFALTGEELTIKE